MLFVKGRTIRNYWRGGGGGGVKSSSPLHKYFFKPQPLAGIFFSQVFLAGNLFLGKVTLPPPVISNGPSLINCLSASTPTPGHDRSYCGGSKGPEKGRWRGQDREKTIPKHYTFSTKICKTSNKISLSFGLKL